MMGSSSGAAATTPTTTSTTLPPITSLHGHHHLMPVTDLDVIQDMIDCSADRLEGLRTQCSTSATLTQREIRSLETKLLRMFSELLLTRTRMSERDHHPVGDGGHPPPLPPPAHSNQHELRQWLRVVGLTESSIKVCVKHVSTLEELLELFDPELKDLVTKNPDYHEDEIRRLIKSIHSLRTCKELLNNSGYETEVKQSERHRSTNKPTKEEREQLIEQLFWDSWDHHHQHQQPHQSHQHHTPQHLHSSGLGHHQVLSNQQSTFHRASVGNIGVGGGGGGSILSPRTHRMLMSRHVAAKHLQQQQQQNMGATTTTTSSSSRKHSPASDGGGGGGSSNSTINNANSSTTPPKISTNTTMEESMASGSALTLPLTPSPPNSPPFSLPANVVVVGAGTNNNGCMMMANHNSSNGGTPQRSGQQQQQQRQQQQQNEENHHQTKESSSSTLGLDQYPSPLPPPLENNWNCEVNSSVVQQQQQQQQQHGQRIAMTRLNMEASPDSHSTTSSDILLVESITNNNNNNNHSMNQSQGQGGGGHIPLPPLSPCTPLVNLGMSHSIAHRFNTVFKMTSTTCDLCQKPMFIGRKCKECKYRCHKLCEPDVPPSCCLPPEFIDEFKNAIKDPVGYQQQQQQQHNNTPTSNNLIMHSSSSTTTSFSSSSHSPGTLNRNRLSVMGMAANRQQQPQQQQHKYSHSTTSGISVGGVGVGVGGVHETGTLLSSSSSLVANNLIDSSSPASSCTSSNPSSPALFNAQQQQQQQQPQHHPHHHHHHHVHLQNPAIQQHSYQQQQQLSSNIMNPASSAANGGEGSVTFSSNSMSGESTTNITSTTMSMSSQFNFPDVTITRTTGENSQENSIHSMHPILTEGSITNVGEQRVEMNRLHYRGYQHLDGNNMIHDPGILMTSSTTAATTVTTTTGVTSTSIAIGMDVTINPLQPGNSNNNGQQFINGNNHHIMNLNYNNCYNNDVENASITTLSSSIGGGAMGITATSSNNHKLQHYPSIVSNSINNSNNNSNSNNHNSSSNCNNNKNSGNSNNNNSNSNPNNNSNPNSNNRNNANNNININNNREITTFLPRRQFHELADTNKSNDSDKTTVSLSGSTSASTDSDRTPIRLDSTEEGEMMMGGGGGGGGGGIWRRQNSMSLKEWDIPFGDLLMLEKIGQGRFGTVHRALWHGSVAVKLLKGDYLDDEQMLEAFKLEVANFKKTRHENLVLFMGACMNPPYLAIVTSLCKGNTLYTHIHTRREKFVINRTTLIAQQITQGMGYLHARGIIHKDLRTKNIFLENGKVIITDFGLFSSTKLLYGEKGLGVPSNWLCYLAPELMRGLMPSKPSEEILMYSMASDVYSFGTVWYELLCGEFPFKTQSPEAVIWQVGRGMKQTLANLQTSRDVKDILMLCWHYTADDRPDFPKLLTLFERLPKKRLARSPSHPVQLSRSAEAIF